jgi:hypothetical protein
MRWLQLLCALLVVTNVESFAAAFAASAGASSAVSTSLPLQKIVIIGDARVAADSKADFYTSLKANTCIKMMKIKLDTQTKQKKSAQSIGILAQYI